MNLLSHLWDDTVAGPPPDDGGGLGKLRKFSAFNSRPDSRNESESPNPRSLTVDTTDDGMKVTRSIKILKSPRNQSKDSPPSSPSPSPAGSTPPVSPFSFSGLGGKEAYRFRRKSASYAYEDARGVGPRSPPPPPYDV
ncbi:unnamed protein product [Cuscuta campestris]|uniref:Uncharacterized protein n=1 Tax=Cuscuta campestris TaxID=132261 RepID=A0A484M806_9ASTE|nr:unnamed protein product [Cuscuta campestris]